MFKRIQKLLRRQSPEISAEEAERFSEAERRIHAYTLLRKHTITPEEYEDLLRK